LRPTLFHIPHDIGPWPLFGFGIAFTLLVLFGIVVMAIQIRRHGLGNEALGYLPVFAVMAGAIVFVLPNIEEPSGLPIRGFGVTMLLGVGSGVALSAYRARQRGLDPELIYSLAFWLFVAGIAGARAFYVIEYWKTQFARPTWHETIVSVISIQEGGLVVYGSILGGAAALVAFTLKHKVPFFAMSDLIVPGLMLGIAFGRIGCFLNGCCYGGVCELPWSVSFPPGSPAYMRQMERGTLYGIQVADTKLADSAAPQVTIVGVKAGSQAEKQGIHDGDRVVMINERSIRTVGDAWQSMARALEMYESVDLVTDHGRAVLDPLEQARFGSMPVHPTQLYSVLDAAIICWFLLAYEPLKTRDGQVGAWVCTLYPITRFLIEAIRSDEPAVFGTGFTISQNISLAILAFGISLWIWLWRQPPKVAWPLRSSG
jgi:phosphatidylglycerol:prolipoprotein diacylglycerol transferase